MKLTKQQAINVAISKLKQAQVNEDTELAHADADDALMGLLLELGHLGVVEEYEKVSKWYA